MEFKRIADYPLTEADVERLQSLACGYDSYVVRNRAHGVLLLFKDGRSFEDVAAIFGVHRNSVSNWAERWIAEGIDGLYDRPGRGAKPLFDKTEWEAVVQCVEETPRSLRQAARKVEAVTGKRASLATLRKILKKSGKSWKRQRKVESDKPSEEQYEKGKDEIAELKRLAEDGEFALVYFDESGFDLTPAVPYAWQNLGRSGTQGIPSTKSKRINKLGFLEWGGTALTTFERIGSVNSAVVIAAMDAYCAELDGPAVVVLDNATIHTAEAVSKKRPEWEKRGLTLYFLPPYSPQLNPIEIVWRKIKYEWMPAWAYQNFDSLQEALAGIIHSFGIEHKIQFSR